MQDCPTHWNNHFKKRLVPAMNKQFKKNGVNMLKLVSKRSTMVTPHTNSGPCVHVSKISQHTPHRLYPNHGHTRVATAWPIPSYLPHNQFVLTVMFPKMWLLLSSSSVGHGVCPCNWIHHFKVLLCSPCLHLLVDWRHRCWICVPSVGKDAQWKSESSDLFKRLNWPLVQLLSPH